MNQNQALLIELQKGREVSSMQMIQEFGITRLSARIFELKEAGHKIITRNVTAGNRFGNPVTYAKYKLQEQES